MRRLIEKLRAWANRPLEMEIARIHREVCANISLLSNEMSRIATETSLIGGWDKSNVLLAASLVARAARLSSELNVEDSQRPRLRDIPFETALASLKELSPALFPTWLQLFENG